jgi:predicted TIM-barrel fold metal-dependent hydrolase
MTIVDAWVSIWDEQTAAQFSRDPRLVAVQQFFGKDLDAGLTGVDALLAAMDAAGVDLAIVGGQLAASRFDRASNDVTMEAVHQHPERLRAALSVDPVRSVRATCDALEAACADELVAAVRVVPMLSGQPINHRTYYPVYERCEALGVPVTVNVGVPGPKFRARHQDPLDLDDVCIDFPDLTVVGAHMGHPWESLLIRLMMKYENLYLSNSAYLARYMDPAIVGFMDSSRGRHKLIFASDEPLIPMARALDDARALDIGPEALAAFLGDNALRVFRMNEPTEKGPGEP